MKTTDERFWEKVNKTSSCWFWTASGTLNGYGQIKIDGKQKLAHRVSYEMEIGPIPKGLQIDHLCRVRNCVNPSHLEPVTAQENNRRGVKGNKGKHESDKTHCPRGHEYNQENTHIRKQSRKPGFGRMCRACDRLRKAERSRLVRKKQSFSSKEV